MTSRHSLTRMGCSLRRVALLTCAKNKLRKFQSRTKDQLRGYCIKSVMDDGDFDQRVEVRMWEVTRFSLRDAWQNVEMD